MPRREAAVIEEPVERVRWVRFTFWLITGIVAMVSALVVWHFIEEFLIKDDRFRIPEADDFAGQSPNLVVEGIHYASTSQIRHIFSEDFGRSLYLVPIQKRRAQLLAIDWVENATVAKIWPNTVKVVIHERVPVAFVVLPANRKDGSSSFALVDRDGYILRPRVMARFTLPVITGVRENESLEDRRVRVRRVLAMLKEIGPMAAQISEINVADPNDLIVEEKMDNVVLSLMLGDENYSDRLQNFSANYAEIREKRPDARTLDLRVDGVITAVGDDQSGK
ncbi:MAG: cell division protein FtsQ/DivIB [Acidobacteriaceae bacterium]|nr:cell division protein FtsQ/DivIB [Acidobacteriaceae bacterium]